MGMIVVKVEVCLYSSGSSDDFVFKRNQIRYVVIVLGIGIVRHGQIRHAVVVVTVAVVVLCVVGRYHVEPKSAGLTLKLKLARRLT